MITPEQLSNDIKFLPDAALQAVGIIVREILSSNKAAEQKQRPVYGSGKGKMWISEDFDAPLDELKEYME